MTVFSDGETQTTCTGRRLFWTVPPGVSLRVRQLWELWLELGMGMGLSSRGPFVLTCVLNVNSNCLNKVCDINRSSKAAYSLNQEGALRGFSHICDETQFTG